MNSPLNSFQLGSPGPCRGTRCLLLLQGLCEWQLYPLPLSFLAEAALGGQKQVSEHSPPPPKAACQLFSRERFGGETRQRREAEPDTRELLPKPLQEPSAATHAAQATAVNYFIFQNEGGRLSKWDQINQV